MPLDLPTVTLLAAAAGDPPDWTDKASAIAAITAAAAAVLTLIVAVAAAVFAKRQVKEAQTTRREQAQPYVVVYAEPHRRSRHAVEIAIRNFGSTGASNVTISCTPELKRSDPNEDGFERVELPWTSRFSPLARSGGPSGTAASTGKMLTCRTATT